MTENKRYYIGNGKNCTICDSNQGGSDFYNMLTQFEAVDRLNEQEERIKQLEKDVLDLQAEIGRLNCKKEIEKPHWLKYETSQGYTSKANQNIRFKGGVDD